MLSHHVRPSETNDETCDQDPYEAGVEKEISVCGPLFMSTHGVDEVGEPVSLSSRRQLSRTTIAEHLRTAKVDVVQVHSSLLTGSATSRLRVSSNLSAIPHAILTHICIRPNVRRGELIHGQTGARSAPRGGILARGKLTADFGLGRIQAEVEVALALREGSGLLTMLGDREVCGRRKREDEGKVKMIAFDGASSVSRSKFVESPFGRLLLAGRSISRKVHA
jgi:hypothetical protein